MNNQMWKMKCGFCRVFIRVTQWKRITTECCIQNKTDFLLAKPTVCSSNISSKILISESKGYKNHHKCETVFSL